MPARSPRKTRPADARALLHRRYVEGKPGMERLLSEAREQYAIADQIYGLRTAAGLTQEELAKLTGTTRSVISRLEAAEYAGHSMSMLNRVASALGHRVEVRFVPLEKVETG